MQSRTRDGPQSFASSDESADRVELFPDFDQFVPLQLLKSFGRTGKDLSFIYRH